MSHAHRSLETAPFRPATLRAAGLRSLGVYRPRHIVTNDSFDLGEQSDSWIRRRTGICERRYAGPEESVVSMAVGAADHALASADLDPTQIGSVIVATSTYMQLTPPAAAAVAHRIGASAASTFDLTAGCAGFCHALAIAADLVAAGTCDHVLVIGSEKMSNNLDPTDAATAPLFGDGAGAVVVSVADEHGIGPVVWGADGGRPDMITQSPTFEEYCAGERARLPAVAMDGPGVYRWARRILPAITAQLLDQLDDHSRLRAFIPHQANLRIIEAAQASIGLSESVAVATDVTLSGNTSAASVPLAMHRLLSEGAVRPGDLAALVAFGSGLCWAGQLVRLPEFTATPAVAAGTTRKEVHS